jgi:hypothetical protein
VVFSAGLVGCPLIYKEVIGMPSDREIFERDERYRSGFTLLKYADMISKFKFVNDSLYSITGTEQGIVYTARFLDMLVEEFKPHVEFEDKPIRETIRIKISDEIASTSVADIRAMYCGEWAGYVFFLDRKGLWQFVFCGALSSWRKDRGLEFVPNVSSEYMIRRLIFDRQETFEEGEHMTTTPLHAMEIITDCLLGQVGRLMSRRQKRIDEWRYTMERTRQSTALAWRFVDTRNRD